jgi:AraC-like DNA-binding protein
MKNQIELEQILEIYRLLFEIATGKSVPIQKKDNEDFLGYVYNTLVNINNILDQYLLDNDVHNPYLPYQNLTQLTFVTDKKLTIKSFTCNVPVLLHHSTEELVNLPFKNLIAKEFLHVWKQIILEEKDANIYAKLTFKTSEGQYFPAFCAITRLQPHDEIVITSIITESKSAIILSQEWFELTKGELKEKQLIVKLHAYIMENLHQQLPSLETIAKELGSEGHILKVGFRKYYNTSVYQFYNDERLKKAEILILQTVLPLKEIAFQCGFKTYLSFFKAFKKKYSYAPSNLLRKSEK